MIAAGAHSAAFGALSALLAACSASSSPVEHLELPAGFAIEIYVEDIPDARSMALGDAGTVFVGSRAAGAVYAVAAVAGAAKPRVRVLRDGLYLPNGVAYRDGDLYVAEVHRLLRFRGIESRLDAPGEPEVLIDDLPRDAHHGARYLAVGPDGRLYLTIGAPCNVCDAPGYAMIISLAADGTDRQVYARGVRNSLGLDWHPQTRELWFTDNGRDWLGDERPPDELNRAPRAGLDFGFPYCHGGTIRDADFGALGNCADAAAPAVALGAHVAALGLRFYTGEMFPPEYRGRAFIAEHGSWNRRPPDGYRLSSVTFGAAGPADSVPFATGWLGAGGEVSGRPVDLLVMPDGALLVSDDTAGAIYRITYTSAGRDDG